MDRPAVRGVFLADTHLGIDWPMKPRVTRRRRGDDFFGNYVSVLQHAIEGGFDFVLHGGDLFYRSRVPDSLVVKVFEPLLDVAEAGVDVYIVPGNHERSRIPESLFAGHPRIHVFDRPRSYVLKRHGRTVELTGFPFMGSRMGSTFTHLAAALEKTWQSRADIRLLCIHEIVEGARVGPSDFQFRSGPDVIRGADIPRDYAAVLSGHIHRHQALAAGPNGRTFPVAVYYPGSIERTSFAEADEEKGFLELDLIPGFSARWVPLPTRPMVTLVLDPGELTRLSNPQSLLAQRILENHPDSVLRIKFTSPPSQALSSLFAAANLRAIAPRMNITLSGMGGQRSRFQGRRG